jgi:hypothetical protein
MDVVIYRADIFLNGRWQQSFFISDGEGADLEFGTASAAGAAAYAMDAARGRESTWAEVEALLAAGALPRFFKQTEQAPKNMDDISIIPIAEFDPESGIRLTADVIYLAVGHEGKVLVNPETDREEIVKAVTERSASGPRPR